MEGVLVNSADREGGEAGGQPIDVVAQTVEDVAVADAADPVFIACIDSEHQLMLMSISSSMQGADKEHLVSFLQNIFLTTFQFPVRIVD